MAKPSYYLTNEEWKALKKVTEYAVDIYCDLRKISKDDLSEQTKQQIAGNTVALRWKSYLQQISSPKPGKQKIISEDSMKKFTTFFIDIENDPGNKKYLESGSLPDRIKHSPRFKAISRLHEDLLPKFEYKVRHKKVVRKDSKVQPIQTETDNSSKDVLQSFEGSTWYCFENNEDGFSRKIMQFNEFDSDASLSVTFMHAQEGDRVWQGSARCDFSQGFLIITLVNKKTRRNYTHFMLRINDVYKKMDVCLGHMTSEHFQHGNIVTKTVLLKKLVGAGADTATTLLIPKNDTGLDWQIKEFLRDRVRNRMSSPRKKIITNLNELQGWIAKSRERQNELESDLPKKFEGTYHIFYRIWPYGKPGLQKDIVSLMTTGVEYQHPFRNRNIRWEGYATCNITAQTLTVNLHGPIGVAAKDKKPSNKDKPVFFMLSTPSEEIEEFDTLVGVAAGVRDNNNGTVGRLVVAVKLTDSGAYPTGFDENDLAMFFDVYSERSWVRPPAKTSVVFYEDLARAMEEGLEYQDQVREKHCPKFKE